jgi:aryl-phospho-beta-D-glucosidase BglC (GH1 family)
MKLFAFSALSLAAVLLLGCTSDSGKIPAAASDTSSDSKEAYVPVPVDYSAGRAMNARLGRGINMGNSWESNSYASYKDPGTNHIPEEPYNYGYNDDLDAGWGNPIQDGDFQIIKDAGFNSIRLPVRWQHNSNPVTHEINPERLAGVLEDVTLAVNAGLVVIMDFHWDYEIMEAGNSYYRNPTNADSLAAYEAEKLHFLAIWQQVATTFNAFPDSMLMFDILNEPTVQSADILNDIMLSAYNIIRAAAPGKTIMFQSYHAAKFADIDALTLPQDGNIIFSGHYYEPYTFTHEGHGYACKGDESYTSSVSTDIAKYVAKAQARFPDVNGGHIPMNMGEFGVAAGLRSSCGSEGPSDKYFALWTKKAVAAAEKYDMSWHYWGFTKVGGFEAYDRNENAWYPGILAALFQN